VSEPPTPAPPADGPAPWAGVTWRWFALLAVTTTAMSLYDLDGGPGFEPIDCWVAQTAREMLAAGDWLVPRFAGETRMQKSPGPYWAVMLISLARGTPVDTVSARLPSAIAAVLLVLTIFWLAHRIAGERAARFAGFAAAASVLVLWWSHRAASDLGLTACTTASLAALWVGSEAARGRGTRVALWLAGYFVAGLGMLYKMPMPLVLVGLPAALYVVVLRRWALLASGWHLVGLGLFLLPWLPWALVIIHSDPAALLRWRVEFLDRFTGELPNVAGQRGFAWWFTYLGAAALYTLPFTLSVPAALARAVRPPPGVNRRGTLFLALWFAGHFVFFTVSAGKEWRYLLPALPPLFVLLGIELARLFDPRRRPDPKWDRAVVWAVWLGVPLALTLAGLLGLRHWYEVRGVEELAGLATGRDVAVAFAVTGAILTVGFGLAAALYCRRPAASFALLVVTMWGVWLWAWPRLLPLVESQRAYIDFAHRLHDEIPPEYRPALRSVGFQDPRIVWYSDVRYPRLIDPLQLLREQRGPRRLDYEKRRTVEEIVAALERPAPVLLVARFEEYMELRIQGPPALAAEGRRWPPIRHWLQSRYGDFGRQFVVFGNIPPPFPEPELRLPEKLRARLLAAEREAERLLAARAEGGVLAGTPASAPAGAIGDARAGAPASVD